MKLLFSDSNMHQKTRKKHKKWHRKHDNFFPYPWDMVAYTREKSFFDSVFFLEVWNQTPIYLLEKFGAIPCIFVGHILYQALCTQLTIEKQFFANFKKNCCFFDFFPVFLCPISQLSLFELSSPLSDKKVMKKILCVFLVIWYKKSMQWDLDKNFLSYAKFCPM